MSALPIISVRVNPVRINQFIISYNSATLDRALRPHVQFVFPPLARGIPLRKSFEHV